MALFKCYGLFWSRELYELDDYWIYGWERRYRRKRPSEPEYFLNDQAAIYTLHAPDRDVVYVGQTGGREKHRLGHRLWAHCEKSGFRDRWTHFAWFGLFDPSPCEDKLLENFHNNNFSHQPAAVGDQIAVGSVLDNMEALLITLLEPQLNAQSGRWLSTKRLEQFSYENHVSMRDVWNSIEAIKAHLVDRGSSGE